MFSATNTRFDALAYNALAKGMAVLSSRIAAAGITADGASGCEREVELKFKQMNEDKLIRLLYLLGDCGEPTRTYTTDFFVGDKRLTVDHAKVDKYAQMTCMVKQRFGDADDAPSGTRLSCNVEQSSVPTAADAVEVHNATYSRCKRRSSWRLMDGPYSLQVDLTIVSSKKRGEVAVASYEAEVEINGDLFEREGIEFASVVVANMLLAVHSKPGSGPIRNERKKRRRDA